MDFSSRTVEKTSRQADTNHSSDLKMCGISPRIPEMVFFNREDDEKPVDLREFSTFLDLLPQKMGK